MIINEPKELQGSLRSLECSPLRRSNDKQREDGSDEGTNEELIRQKSTSLSRLLKYHEPEIPPHLVKFDLMVDKFRFDLLGLHNTKRDNSFYKITA